LERKKLLSLFFYLLIFLSQEMQFEGEDEEG